MLHRNFQQSGIGEDKAVVVFFNLQDTINDQVGMDDGVCKGFADSFMLRRIVVTLRSVHLERARQFFCQARQYKGGKVVQVVFPSAVIGEPVTVALFANQVRFVDIVQAEIVKAFPNRKALSKHQESCHGEPFLPAFTVQRISTQLTKELLMVQLVEYMFRIPAAKVVAIGFQSMEVDVIHGVVLQEHTVVSVRESIPHQHLDDIFRTVVVPLTVAHVSPTHEVVVDKDRTHHVFRTRNLYSQYRLSVKVEGIHIGVRQDVHIDFAGIV